MKKLFSLMASAAMLALVACSADGVMESKSEDSDRSGSIASKMAEEAASKREAHEVAASGDVCSVSKSGSQVKVSFNYEPLSGSATVSDFGSFARVTFTSDALLGDFDEICEKYRNVESVTNVECNDAEGILSYDFQYGSNYSFDDVYSEYENICDRLKTELVADPEQGEKEKNVLDDDDDDEDGSDFDEDYFDDISDYDSLDEYDYDDVVEY